MRAKSKGQIKQYLYIKGPDSVNRDMENTDLVGYKNNKGVFCRSYNLIVLEQKLRLSGSA